MPTSRTTLAPGVSTQPPPGWADLRRQLAIPESFPPDVLAGATAAADTPIAGAGREDRRDLELCTLDPPGSMDLDQAFGIERRGDGHRVWYAIADVAAFVQPGGAVDLEAHRRGETLYAPDERVPLYPPALGEGAASLLEGQDRAAVLWRLDLDDRGTLVTTQVERALVRSRRRLDYPGVQRSIDDGAADAVLLLLREVGDRRQSLARERGAIDLPTPEQEVAIGASGQPELTLRAPLPCEGWNAQLSLLTGMAAAALMLDGGIGLLRTLPPPDAAAVASLRRSALALGVGWPEGDAAGDIISALDPADQAAAAVLALAPRLLRGAGYTAFDGAPPAQPLHSGVAAPYAHCTAPLRRLADRYVGEVCLALCAGADVPSWARAALPVLPDEMATADHRAHELERAVTDLAEALVLAPLVGQRFSVTVVEQGKAAGVVQLSAPAVRARCEGHDLPVGRVIDVRLVTADPATRTVVFAPA